MKIIICGAGEVGTHAAQTLGEIGQRIIMVDNTAQRLRDIEDSMDVATLLGNCADANVLKEAGCEDADLLIAATDSDEINLLAASIAKGLGVRKCIARAHHNAFVDRSALDYQQHFHIDRLICPEFATALAIARKIRSPGAVAIENFARGSIEIQEFTTGRKGAAIGKRLVDVRLPTGARLAMIQRQHEAILPEAGSVIAPGENVVLVGNASIFHDARKLFQDDRAARKKVVLLGGTSMAVWLSRALHDRSIELRLFEKDRGRAEVLAEKLEWVTVIHGDPTDRATFDEEHLVQADVFVPLLGSDESNIIAAVLAKIRGVANVITVVEQSKYLDVTYDIGVDHAFSTRIVAAQEIENVLDERPLRHLGTLAEGCVEVYRVRISDHSPLLGKPLKDIKLSPDWMVAAIQRERSAYVPGADDVFKADDVALLVGKSGTEKSMKNIFAVK